MKKVLVLIPLLILIQPAFADISIQNDQTYVGNDGVLHIVGEIENNSKTPLNKIKITATLTDENGSEIKRIDGKVMSNTLMPGMKTGFDIITVEKIKTDMINYDLELDYKMAAPKSQVIDIVSSELTRDKMNNVVISGTLENNGEITANMINVVASCIEQIYDKKGEDVYASKDSTKQEIVEFIEQMNSAQFADVQEFFDTMPKLQHTITVKNPKTKVESEVVLNGLNDFFE